MIDKIIMSGNNEIRNNYTIGLDVFQITILSLNLSLADSNWGDIDGFLGNKINREVLRRDFTMRLLDYF